MRRVSALPYWGGAEGVVKFLQTSRHSFEPAHYSTNQCRAAQCPSHANGQLSQQNSTPLLGKSPLPLVLKGAEPLFGFCEAEFSTLRTTWCWHGSTSLRSYDKQIHAMYTNPKGSYTYKPGLLYVIWTVSLTGGRQNVSVAALWIWNGRFISVVLPVNQSSALPGTAANLFSPLSTITEQSQASHDN